MMKKDVLGFYLHGVGEGASPSIAHPRSESSAPENVKPAMTRKYRRWTKYLSALRGGAAITAQLRSAARKGIPANFRSEVWQIALRIEQRRKMKGVSFLALKLKGATPDAMRSIQCDVPRTGPHNPLFQSKEGLNQLEGILVAWAAFRPDVGYCQSLNYVAATLLLVLKDEELAFWGLVQLLDASESTTGLHTLEYYRAPMSKVLTDIEALAHILSLKMPFDLPSTLRKIGVPLSALTLKWFLTLYTTELPEKALFRVWDCLIFDGPTTIFRIALSLILCNLKTWRQVIDVNDAFCAARETTSNIKKIERLIKQAYPVFNAITAENIATARSCAMGPRCRRCLILVNKQVNSFN